MTDTISLFRAFVRVVEAGSFTRVAQEQNSSQPTVSRQVAALEEHLGARLFTRTTRKLTLTDDGRGFYERAKLAIEAVSEAEDAVGRRRSRPSGALRLALPVVFGRLRVIPHLKEFLTRYPDVSIDLAMNDAQVDLVEEVMRITNGKGARVVFDPVGGPNFPKLISALAFQGTVYIYGALAEGDTPMPVLAMIAKMPVIKGHNIWLTTGDEARRKAAVAFVLKGLESGALKPVIDRAFTFDDMVEVHRYLENNGQFGKIVVTV